MQLNSLTGIPCTSGLDLEPSHAPQRMSHISVLCSLSVSNKSCNKHTSVAKSQHRRWQKPSRVSATGLAFDGMASFETPTSLRDFDIISGLAAKLWTFLVRSGCGP